MYNRLALKILLPGRKDEKRQVDSIPSKQSRAVPAHVGMLLQSSAAFPGPPLPSSPLPPHISRAPFLAACPTHKRKPNTTTTTATHPPTYITKHAYAPTPPPPRPRDRETRPHRTNSHRTERDKRDDLRRQQQVRRHVRAHAAVHEGAAAGRRGAAAGGDPLAASWSRGGRGVDGRQDHAALPHKRRRRVAAVPRTAGRAGDGSADHLLRRSGARVRGLPGREGQGSDAAGGVGVLAGVGRRDGSAGRAAEDRGPAAPGALRHAHRQEGVAAAVPPKEEAQDHHDRSVPEGDGVAGGERRRCQASER